MKQHDIRNQTDVNTSPTRSEIALLLLRGIAGTIFTFHGAQKVFGLFGGPGLDGFAAYLGSIGVPLPYLNAYLAGGAELLGGIALLAGVGVRLVAVPLTITMLVACFALRAGGFDAQKGGFEFPLSLAVITVAIALLGPGRFSLPAALRREPAKTATAPLSQASHA